MTGPESPLFAEKAHPPIECPVCGGLYEEPFALDGRPIRGHIPGGPTCPGRAGVLSGSARDSRNRRATRRGR